MGLDMYLYAKEFLTSAPWLDEDDGKKVKSVARMMKGTKFLDKDDLQFAQVKLLVAYWRKANQIHKFFIDQCNHGFNDGQDMYVDRDVLKELLNRCETVLKDHSKAEELLPTQAGFFFGSTDYDEYYYEDLERTVPILKKILKSAPESWEFEYCPSW